MPIYTVYTKRRIIPVVTSHVCSECGKTVLQKQMLSVDAKYSDRGSFTKKSLSKRENAALDDLKESENQLKNKLRNINAESDFSSFRLNGRCNFCGNVEPWAKMYNIIFDVGLSILRVVGAIAILLVLLMLFNGAALSEVSVFLYLVIGVWLLTESGYLVLKVVFRGQIRKLKAESLPKVYSSQKEIEELIKNSRE